MSDLIPVRRALLSVADKTDLVPFARALVNRGVEIISTGGTAAALSDAGIVVTPVDQVTGFPEIMDGRVKTLHPGIHGALLALTENDSHLDAMKTHGITPIDLVCINLYPFERTIADADVEQAEAIEQIDIGGPAMIRSAAKNFARVTVITSPRRYDRVVSELSSNNGATSFNLRAELAAAAFGRTAEYDAAIASYLGRSSPTAFPQVLRLGYTKVDDLRYGENPHQEAALYRDPASTGPTIVNAEQLHGKPLSYNNISDAAAALELVKGLRLEQPDDVGAAVIKHANPCGCAVAPDAATSVRQAIACNPLAAYGGILALNAPINRAVAQAICAPDQFLEVVVAPSVDEDALAMLQARWTNVRILAVGTRPGSTKRRLDYHSIPGGMLVQDRDIRSATPKQWEHRAGPEPTSEQLQQGAVLASIGRFLASNAVVIGGPAPDEPSCTRLFGAGTGQVDRLSACRHAVAQASDLAQSALAFSDAFFPFPDGPQVLIDAGVGVIIHPGGSKRDDETFALCDTRGVTCVTTGIRRFRH